MKLPVAAESKETPRSDLKAMIEDDTLQVRAVTP